VSGGIVRVGVVAPQTTGAVRALEELGVDSLWVGGHLASPNPSPEPLVWLARLAEQSERATIGTATLVLPWYPPAVAAKQLADIDRATKGRLVVGVGSGGEYPDDFAAAGVPMAERGERLDESIGLLRKFWTAEAVDHSGRHFHYEKLRIHPAPARPGGPPIVVTGRRRAAMRRAASLGDGWMPYLYSAERYARSVAAIREFARTAGRSLEPFRWMAYVMVSVDSNHARARERAARFLGTTYSQEFDHFIDRVSVAGTLEEVVDGLVAFVDAGARHLVLLPCHDPDLREVTDGHPWLPELLAGVRGATRSRSEPEGS
jgi:alkanesulfonate monooxygenase SsuD/methylene tetrahydromethanopterin reductase-like flavin-dependent oxidoreductase (luciferase family)